MVCLCKKTKCLKAYCACFQQGSECTEQCGCINCYNKENEDNPIVLALREKARKHFKLRKKLKTSHEASERSCNCVKSGCLKKYCLCYASGSTCSSSCRCKDCGNQALSEVEDSGGEKEDEKAKEENKEDPAIVTPEGGGAVHAYYNPITRGKPISAAQRLVSVPRTPPGSHTSFEGDADLSSAKWSRYGVHVPQTP